MLRPLLSVRVFLRMEDTMPTTGGLWWQSKKREIDYYENNSKNQMTYLPLDNNRNGMVTKLISVLNKQFLTLRIESEWTSSKSFKAWAIKNNNNNTNNNNKKEIHSNQLSITAFYTQRCVSR